MSDFRFEIPPQFRPYVPFALQAVPLVALWNGKLIQARATLAKVLEDFDVDLEDVATIAGAIVTAPTAPGRPPVIVLPPHITPIPVPPQHPDDDDDLPDLPEASVLWPDRVSIELKHALEPGTDAEGQQVLVYTPTELQGNTIVFSNHPDVVNDRTKITLEAGLALGTKGLHFSEHPHLVGTIEWVALVDGQEVGTIGGSGSVAPGFPRKENGVGFGGNRYFETLGTQGVASIKPSLKGKIVELFARCPKAPSKPRSESFFTRLVV